MAEKIGAKMRMKPGLKDWVWAAVMFTPPATNWVLASAKRLSDVPACSNRVQNTTEPAISTMARPSRSRSTLPQRANMNQKT